MQFSWVLVGGQSLQLERTRETIDTQAKGKTMTTQRIKELEAIKARGNWDCTAYQPELNVGKYNACRTLKSKRLPAVEDILAEGNKRALQLRQRAHGKFHRIARLIDRY